MPEKPKNKSILSFFLLAIPVSLFFAIIITLLILSYLVYTNYSKWTVEFEDSHLSTDYIQIPDDNYEKKITAKIEKYSKSTDIIDYIEFTNEEFSYLFSKSVQSSLPEYMSINKTISSFNNNTLSIFMNINVLKNQSIWFRFDITKDVGEGYEIFLSDMYIADYSFNEYGMRKIVVDINTALSDTLKLINDNEFSIRVLQNIELTSKSVIFKAKLR